MSQPLNRYITLGDQVDITTYKADAKVNPKDLSYLPQNSIADVSILRLS